MNMPWLRIFFCGLIAGLVWTLLSILLVSLLGREFTAAVKPTNPDASGLSLYLLSVAAGVWAVWLYSIVRTRCGPGLKSAIVVAVAWWVMAGMQSLKWLAVLDIAFEKVLPLTLAGLVAMIVAVRLGAWCYDRGEQPNAT